MSTTIRYIFERWVLLPDCGKNATKAIALDIKKAATNKLLIRSCWNVLDHVLSFFSIVSEMIVHYLITIIVIKSVKFYICKIRLNKTEEIATSPKLKYLFRFSRNIDKLPGVIYARENELKFYLPALSSRSSFKSTLAIPSGSLNLCRVSGSSASFASSPVRNGAHLWLAIYYNYSQFRGHGPTAREMYEILYTYNIIGAAATLSYEPKLLSTVRLAGSSKNLRVSGRRLRL